jgi:hypothetical protein
LRKESKNYHNHPPVAGPFRHEEPRSESPKEVKVSVNSRVYFYDQPDRLVVKQRKETPTAPYGSVREAIEDQERLRAVREKFQAMMPSHTPTAVLPPVTEVIHQADGSQGVQVSWVSPLVEEAQTLSELSLPDFLSLPAATLQILLDIVKTDRRLFKEGTFMDVVGSSQDQPTWYIKWLRWPFAILWSKNIVISQTDHSQLPIFIDREGREVSDELTFKRKVRTMAYPYRLLLSELLLKSMLLFKREL